MTRSRLLTKTQVIKMKTKNAFAFRDFDKQKILQRRFFKDFHFDADKSDTEILQDLSLADNDSLPTIERKHQVLKSVFDRLSRLDVLVCNHTNRIKRCQQNLSKEINSIRDDDAKKKLEQRYSFGQSIALEYIFGVSSGVEDLMKPLEKIWRELENKLQELYRENFAERLKRARLKAKLSRKELGDTINLSPNGYGQYESARREPSLTSLIRLSRTLKVSADWLIGVTP